MFWVFMLKMRTWMKLLFSEPNILFWSRYEKQRKLKAGFTKLLQVVQNYCRYFQSGNREVGHPIRMG